MTKQDEEKMWLMLGEIIKRLDQLEENEVKTGVVTRGMPTQFKEWIDEKRGDK